MPEANLLAYLAHKASTEPTVDKKTTAFEVPRALPQSLSPVQIQRMGKDELLLLQRHFRLGTEWGQIRFPDEWISGSQPNGQGTVNLYTRLGSAASTKLELELGVITAVRMVLLVFCVPTQCGTKAARHLAPTTILTRLVGPWINFIKFALGRPSNDNNSLLGRIENYAYRSREHEEAKRFGNLHARGLWTDTIEPPRIESLSETSNRDVLDEMRVPSKGGRTKDPYLPFPDAFVHEAGRCSAWLINEFMPMLLTGYEAVLTVIENRRDKMGTDNEFCRPTADFLLNYQWRDLAGNPFVGIPFSVDVNFGSRPCTWPPLGLQEFQQFVMMAQMANFFVVALSAGPRAGEILSFTTDCLTESRDGVALANGRTYKIVDAFEGVTRDWPMPQLAVQALQYQSRLSVIISRQYQSQYEPGNVPLWRLFHASGAGASLGANYNSQMRLYVRRLKLGHLIDSQALSHHRFRKTIARLVALAQVHAPKILMDIFGHRSIEMTMHYILADASILSEMRAVRKELVLIMAKKAIRNAASNGGPAAPHISNAVQQIGFRTSGEYGVENEDDLAMMLTGQGVYWIQPRPGVICTKLVDQVGPCAKGRSQPNPARCQSDCTFRLEEADNRHQVDEAITDIVQKIQRAWAHEDEILAEVWTGQLVTNLSRFNDLSVKWLEHPVVKSALNRNNGKAADVET